MRCHVTAGRRTFAAAHEEAAEQLLDQDDDRREIGYGAARRIFETLVDAGGVPLTRELIAERCGIDLATSTFRNTLTDLRKWDLIDGKRDLSLSAEMVEALG